MLTSTTTSALPTASAARPAPTVPSSIPWLGSAVDFGRDPDHFITSCRDRYGSAFKVVMAGEARTFLTDPFDYPRFFHTKELIFREVAELIGQRIFGYNIDRFGNDLLKDLLEAVYTNLKGDALIAITDRMNRIFLQRLQSVVSKEWTHDSLLRFLHDHVFAAGAEALFGDGFYTAEVHRAFTVIDRCVPLLVVGVPARVLPGLIAARDMLSETVMIDRPGQSTLATQRLALARKTGLPTRAAGRINIPFVWASQANTIPAAFWTLLLILRDPHARAQILDEIREVSAAFGYEGGVLSLEMMRKMVKLDSAITEVTRLMSAPLVIREATTDLEFPRNTGAPLVVRKGEQLCPYPRIVHLDPEIFSDPHVFKFDRFLHTDGPKHFYKNGQRVAFAMLPFGGGESMCPGRFFVRNEFKIVVATLLGACDVELGSAVVPALKTSRFGLGVPSPQTDIPFRIRRKAA